MKLAIAAALVLAVTATAAGGGPGRAVAKPDPTAGLAKLPAQQIAAIGADVSGGKAPAAVKYAPDARFTFTGPSAYTPVGTLGPDELGRALFLGYPEATTVKDLAVGVAADGQTAWLSCSVKVHVIFDDNAGEQTFGYRASEVLGRDGDGWKILGGAWSAAEPNGSTNAAAKAKKLDLDEVADAGAGGDAGVRAAFDALLATGVDATAAARKDLIAIGSGPGERTTSGAVIAKAWKAAWVGHVALDGAPRIGVAPGGTTAWVTANVKLTKGAGAAAYAIPFRIFAVFDKTGDAWSLVHVHFAVPAP